MQTTHQFDSSNEAYDACQVGETYDGDKVNDRDILVIKSEQVVGLADTWPLAVTTRHGAFHVPEAGIKACDIQPITSSSPVPYPAYAVEGAVKVARELGYMIADYAI